MERRMTSLDHLLAPVPAASKRLWIAAAAGTILAGAAAYEYLQAKLVFDRLTQEAAALHVPPPPKPQLSKAEIERQQQWRKLAVERGFSWYPIFRALERASTDEVELLEFDPDKANRQLVLRGEARNLEALTAYLARLSGQDIIGRAYLTHQRSAARQSLKTLSFEIKASIAE
jgi:hypothetical protein